jgi:DNA polymerase-1
MAMSKVILIDGNSLAYRAFYALPDTMRNSAGLTTNAIYGFTTMLLKVLDAKPDFVAIAFDRPEPTFRHKEYKEYKATRDKAPPTLHEQIPYVKQVAEAFNIPVYEIAGYEADDVIGTLAKEAAEQGHNVEILTGDLDALQLVTEQIKVMSTRKGLTDTILYGPEEVLARYGIKPEQVIDYKALKGDTTDNIPGVPGIGEKTAAQLLKEFGTLDNILNNADRISAKGVREKVSKNKELAKISQMLATIVTNVPLKLDFAKSQRGAINWSKVVPLFEQLDFDSLVKKYSKYLTAHSSATIVAQKREALADFKFQAIHTENQLKELVEKLSAADAFAFDTETTGLDTLTAKLIGLSFCCEAKVAYYLPVNGQPQGLPLHLITEHLQPILNSTKLKIGHNLKYDLEILKNHGLEVAGPYFDTMVAAYLLDPIAGKYSLKKLARQFLGREMLKFDEVSENFNFAAVPLAVAIDYACSDAEATFALYNLFILALKAQKLDQLAEKVEMPLVAVLAIMENNGICLDIKYMEKLGSDLDKQLKKLALEIAAIAGLAFNLNSPKQLAQVLFDRLQLPIIKRTKTGPSTDAEVLEELAAQKFEIAEKLLEYRQLAKLKSTYIDVLPSLISSKTARLHTSFNQTITATGRLSSSEPNLQNVPKLLRPAFVPEKKGWVIMAADYSQIELRVLAHLSNDPILVKAFKEGKDVHQATAEELGISRDAAKTVNFGVIYGISDFGLAKQLKIKRTEAADYINKYFTKHTGVKAFIDQTIKEAREKGYATTILGRKRPIPDINNPNHGLRSFAERSAINTPVQGTAADMIKVAMVKINEKLKIKNAKCRMILQVHDELIFETPKEELAEIKKLVEEEMLNALPLSVPILVSLSSGHNWGEAK